MVEEKFQRSPLLQFPGLQIYSSQKDIKSLPHESLSAVNELVSMESLDMYRNLSSEVTPLIDTEDFESSLLNGRQLRYISDLSSPTLHDYSPTIANLDSFDHIQRLQQEIASFSIVTNPIHLNDIVSKLFSEVSSTTESQFLEEFQYTIITSQILNHQNVLGFNFNINKSTLDFHNDKFKNQRNLPFSGTDSFPTKYGRCRKIANCEYQLKKTFDVYKVFMLSYKLLKFVRSSSSTTNTLLSKKKIFIFVSLCLYLSFQQEYFHTQYIRYSSMVQLKRTLKSIQAMNSLIDKYYNAYNQAFMYRTIMATVNNKDVKNMDLINIEQILDSSLGILYFNLKLINREALLVVNTNDLSKFCEIYNIDFTELYSILNLPMDSIKEKLNSVHLLEKFFLCCLLSTNNITTSRNDQVINSLSKIFNDYKLEIQEMKQSRKLDTVKYLLGRFEDSTLSISFLLNANKNLLYSSIDYSPPTSRKAAEDNIYRSSVIQDNIQFSAMVTKLKEIEKHILNMSSNNIDCSLSESISYKLKSIQKLWKNICYQKETTKKRLPNIKSVNNRFSIDICKSPEMGNRQILKDKIKFTEIEDLEPETIIDVETITDIISYTGSGRDAIKKNIKCVPRPVGAIFSNDVDLKECMIPKTSSNLTLKDHFTELTDEELRQKLNEKIIIFAAENKKCKGSIRTQKSFELMRDNKNNIANKIRGMDSQTAAIPRSWSPTNAKCSSEESIPFIYELKELLKNRS